MAVIHHTHQLLHTAWGFGVCYYNVITGYPCRNMDALLFIIHSGDGHLSYINIKGGTDYLSLQFQWI
jgi:hypothetical protein